MTRELERGLQEACGHKVVAISRLPFGEVFDPPTDLVRCHTAPCCQRSGPRNGGWRNVDGGDLASLFGQPHTVATFAAPEIQRAPGRAAGHRLDRGRVGIAGPVLVVFAVQELPELTSSRLWSCSSSPKLLQVRR
jgi:hypothetical protein